MSDYTPKVGDRVRVTIEGTVRREAGAAVPTVETTPGVVIVLSPLVLARDDVTVERIEPGWQPGDVVRDADGFLWNRSANNAEWSLVWAGMRSIPQHYPRPNGDLSRPLVRDDVLPRPLTLLIRDGQAVSA